MCLYDVLLQGGQRKVVLSGRSAPLSGKYNYRYTHDYKSIIAYYIIVYYIILCQGDI